MSVLVVGISHRSAPVSVLERVAVDGEGAAKLLRDVAAGEHVTEAAVIATCNRLEVYADVDRFHGSVEELSGLLVERAGRATEDLLPHLYVHYDDGAVSHLFQVAAGLDSMAVGEGQILGQAREALARGQEAGTVGPSLNVLFQQALRVGKRVHAETAIDQFAPTLVSAALDRIGEVLGRRCGRGGRRLDGRPRHRDADPPRGRRRRRRQPHGQARQPARRRARRPRRGPHPALRRGGRGRPRGRVHRLDGRARDHRDGGRAGSGRWPWSTWPCPTTSSPRSPTSPASPSSPSPTWPRTCTAARRAPRSRPSATSSPQEVAAFLTARRQASVTPTVVALRSMATEVVDAELARLVARLPDLDEASRDEVLQSLRRVADKLLHQPTVRVKELVNETGAVSYAAALAELFALDPDAVEAVTRPEGLS